ncbi:hypothetical protein AAG570_007975 [Ranatra chinensis]|uniref:Integrase catalytic domain-containing protein n=1 Tax=Ranatra chinensis TaxID=642074 RepID=A0ABD0YF69_9HEMI
MQSYDITRHSYKICFCKKATELGIQLLFTTPGHNRSHGAIERLHNTLGEHMRLLEQSRGLKGSVAVQAAVRAYNHSIHKTTGAQPLELMRQWQRSEGERIGEDLQKTLHKLHRLYHLSNIIRLGQLRGREGSPNRPLRVVITAVNDKRLQLILEETDGTDIETSCHRYKHLVTITMKIGRAVADANIWKIVNQIIVPHKEYRVFSRSPWLVGLLEGAYALGRVAAQSTLIRCTRQLQTIEDEQRQREIVEEYHEGPTNHRGVNETIAHLPRSIFGRTCLGASFSSEQTISHWYG